MTVRKWMILSVLEDGCPKTAIDVAVELERRFGLKCHVNSVRKDLKRYSDRRRERLLTRDKKRGSRLCYHYTITERGRKRLQYFNTRKPLQEPEPIYVETRPPDEDPQTKAVRDAVTVKVVDEVLRLSKNEPLKDVAKDLGFWAIWDLQEISAFLPTEYLFMFARFLARPHDGGSGQTPPSPDTREKIWHTLISRRNDEIALLAVRLTETEREIKAYKSLFHHLKDENPRLSSSIPQTSTCSPFFPSNHAALKHFELGYAVGSHHTAANLHTITLAKAAAAWLRRSTEKQKASEHFHAIRFRNALNNNWSNFLPRPLNTLHIPLRGPAGD